MTALALALHILGAVVWVGGMFAAYMCLRPAAGPLEPPARLKLWRAFFGKFFPWVWLAILFCSRAATGWCSRPSEVLPSCRSTSI